MSRESFINALEIETRYVVHVPSIYQSPLTDHYPAEDLDEVRLILSEQGKNARRCAVSDQEAPEGERRLDLDGLL